MVSEVNATRVTLREARAIAKGFYSSKLELRNFFAESPG